MTEIEEKKEPNAVPQKQNVFGTKEKEDNLQKRKKQEKYSFPVATSKKFLLRHSPRVSKSGAIEMSRLMEEEADRISRKVSEIIKMKKKKTVKAEDVKFAKNN